MSKSLQLYFAFSLAMLLLALFFGAVAAFAFLYPEFYNKYLPFYQLRPMHVSSALFWIISGATAGILFYKKAAFDTTNSQPRVEKTFIYLWMGTVVVVFIFYAFKKFGGREYWEFPPFLGLAILAAWLFLMYSYYTSWTKRKKKPPLYVWMWSTGILFFLITFIEQNLYQLTWFRQSFLREITVQWKSNGAMVGAWNQMIYGTSLYIMVKMSGDEQIARGRKTYFFYFLGLTNLMFNWGHHIYNVPGASWIRHVSYAISMTEWLILISIIQGFKAKLTEQRKYRHLLSYRFLIASEYWILLNLLLALFMSIPAVNRYTHGTHITVAHAMGATIGINTMILLASIGYIIKIDRLNVARKKYITIGFITSQASLLVFWLSLITAGILKGYRDVALHITPFQEMMRPVISVLHVFAIAGVVLFAGMALIVFNYFKALAQMKPTHEKRFAKNEGLIGLNPILNNSSKTGNVKPIVKPT
jgi:nitric oxide reductase subunit B